MTPLVTPAPEELRERRVFPPVHQVLVVLRFLTELQRKIVVELIRSKTVTDPLQLQLRARVRGATAEHGHDQPHVMLPERVHVTFILKPNPSTNLWCNFAFLKTKPIL